MSQKSSIFSFDIRKLSIMKAKEIQNEKSNMAANQWFHFPQRTDIYINFFIYLNSVNSFHISITWKGNVLDQTYWQQESNNFISAIGKYPSLGFKIVNVKGDILKRFQVSFVSEKTYTDCCKCVEEKLLVSVNHLVASPANENSQIIDCCSQVPRIIQNSIHTEPYKNVMHNYPQSQSLNKDSQYFPTHEQAAVQQLGKQSQLFELPTDRRMSLHLIPQNRLYPPNALQAYGNQIQSNYASLISNQPQFIDHNLIQDQKKILEYLQLGRRDVTTTNNIPLILSGPLSENTIQTDHINKKRSLSDANFKNTNCEISSSILNKKPKITNEQCIKQEEVLSIIDREEPDSRKSPTKDSSKSLLGLQKLKGRLYSMNDSQLKKLIKQKLKDKEFIKFVKKLEKIVSKP